MVRVGGLFGRVSRPSQTCRGSNLLRLAEEERFRQKQPTAHAFHPAPEITPGAFQILAGVLGFFTVRVRFFHNQSLGGSRPPKPGLFLGREDRLYLPSALRGSPGTVIASAESGRMNSAER